MTGQFPPAPPSSGRDDSRQPADVIRGRIDDLKAVLAAAVERGVSRDEAHLSPPSAPNHPSDEEAE